MTALFNSIVYKQPKPITTYSSKFTDLVKAMLAKKKDERPLITNLIDYFNEQHIPCVLQLSDLDKRNLMEYKTGKV